MPTYTCEKCARVFKQKSGFDDHKAKKNDCASSVVIDAIVASRVEQKVKEAVRAATQRPPITKENLQGFFEDLHNLLWNKAGLNPERALEHMTFFFAYRLIEQQADSLNLPQECRWSHIASITNENDLFETIKKGVSEFRKRQKTKAFFKPHEIQKADIVAEIVQQISRISLEILKETDTLGDIFEYMLGRGMSTMSDEGQYFTIRPICKLAFKLSYDIKKNLRREDGSLCTFADWFCGTGGFPAEYVKGVKEKLGEVDWKKECGSIYCQDMNLSSVTTTLLNMLILTGIPFNGDKIRGSNSFSDPITAGAGAPFDGLKIDYCFMNPPYGGDKSKGKDFKFAYSKKVKAEDGSTSKKFFVNQDIQSIGIEDDDKVSAGVQLAMATLADGGVCSIVLPQGFFFGATKKCVELRKKIAEDYKIWFIVDIASGAFANTGTKTSMMVFQKGSTTDKVVFIGLDEKPLVEATLAELRAKNYSLNYKQYLPQSAVEVEGFEMVKLGDICHTKNGFAIKSENMTKNSSDYPVIKVKNLQDGTGRLIHDNDRINIKLKDDFIVKKGDVLIVMVGNTAGKMAVWEDKDAYLNQNIHKIHFNEKAIPRYVYYILNSPALMEQILPLSSGTAQPFISPSVLYEIQIPLPSLERQKQIVEAIDGWAGLAQHEEVALKILEKQMMFQVKEMGRGQARVKLGEVCDLKSGFAFKSSDFTTGSDDTPVLKITNVNNGFVSFGTEADKIPSDPKYTPFVVNYGDSVISLTGLTEGKILAKYTLPFTSYLNQRVGMLCKYKENVLPDYIYYYLLQNTSSIIELGVGSCQKNVSPSQIMAIEIPLPPLTEQQTLQADFDEIRHKHAKIAVYKAKAQEAIQRLIPGANPV
jgi:type I restriction enzyme S subunit